MNRTDTPDARNESKRRAAREALTRVRSASCVGLGSGSTAAWFIRLLGEALADGSLRDVKGIPTSEASATLARESGVPLTDFDETAACDLTVDGADEVDAHLHLVKGLGGALVREKIVAQNSRRLVIIVDDKKRSDRLCEKVPLPVEVMRWAHLRTGVFLREAGGDPVLRRTGDGSPLVTDNGNYIYDVAFPPLADPVALEARLLRRAGIVQTGLFLSMADEVIVAGDARVEVLGRP